MMNNNIKRRHAFKVMCVLVSLVFTLSSFMCASYAWGVSAVPYGSSAPGYGEIRIFNNAISHDGSELTQSQSSQKFLYGINLPSSSSSLIDYTVMNSEAGVAISAGKAAADGSFTIELKPGECAVMLAPIGAPYRISEQHVTGTVVLSENSQGNVQAPVTNAVFKNAFLKESFGSLEIAKLASQSAPMFEFKVSFMFHGEPYAEPVTMVGPGGEGVFSSGSTIGLSSTQSVVFKGLPVGAAYIVEEVDYSNIWYDSNKRMVEGVIIPDLEDGTPGVRLDIFNEFASKHGYLSYLPITKIVDENPNQPFVFNITLDEGPYKSVGASIPDDSTTGPALVIIDRDSLPSGSGLEAYPPGYFSGDGSIDESRSDVYITDEELNAITNELGVINYNNLPEEKLVGIATMGYRVIFKGANSSLDSWERDGDNIKISLWPGDIATIANVDTGMRYIINEESNPNFTPAIQNISGSIQMKPVVLEFSNHWKPLVPIIIKKVTDNAPPEDVEKEFKIVLLIDGEAVATYNLKNGEQSEPYYAQQGSIFEIIEDDHRPEGYVSSANGYGVTGSEQVEIVTSSVFTPSAPTPTDIPDSAGQGTSTPSRTPTMTPTITPTRTPAPDPGFSESPVANPTYAQQPLSTSPGSTATPVPDGGESGVEPISGTMPTTTPTPPLDIIPDEPVPGGPVATAPPELIEDPSPSPTPIPEAPGSSSSPPRENVANPKTSDDSLIQLWLFLLIASASALVILWINKPVPQERL
jgi:hypothetical protein